MALEAQIREIVEQHLPGEQFFITEVRAKKGGAKTKVSIFVDGDQGIDIGICAQLNRKVGLELEARGLMSGPYTLEVSSPGLDQPLKTPRQYRGNLGRNIRIHLTDEQVEGELDSVSEEFITVKQKSKKGQVTVRQIPFQDIIKTHVLVSF